MPRCPPIERKIAVLGFRGVGKSCLTIQYVEGHFPDSYNPTIENTFSRSHTFMDRDYQLHLVDTAGQDEYSLFPPSYTMDVHGYVLVYAINYRKSFEVVQVIHDKILDMACRDSVPLALVGNKTDLYLDREVTKEEGQELARRWKAAFLETSAKDNRQVSDVFDKVVYEIEKSQGNIVVNSDKNKCTVS